MKDNSASFMFQSNNPLIEHHAVSVEFSQFHFLVEISPELGKYPVCFLQNKKVLRRRIRTYIRLRWSVFDTIT